METNYSLLENEEKIEDFSSSVNTLAHMECTDMQKSGYASQSSDSMKRGCLTEKQSNILMLIWSIFNFLCYPHCGTPAIIFSLLSRISKQRNDQLSAKFHFKYSLVFNLISTIFCCFSFVFSVIFSIVYYSSIVKPYLVYANQHKSEI